MKTNLKFIALGLAAISAVASVEARNNDYGSDPYFSDITLINCGEGAKRAAWTEEDFEPYLVHKYTDGHEAWFFDAFLFVDTQRGNKKFGNDIPGTPASKADWQWMLDQFFDPTLKLQALDNLIEKKKATLGEPPLKHRVVLSLCLPTLDNGAWSRNPWGLLDGLNLNFTTLDNRMKAMRWYIDTMVDTFNARGYRNLTLAGVYWIEESIYTNTDLAPLVTDYVRSKGLRTYWIPYYVNNSSSFTKARSTFKIDLTYLQPNFAFLNGPDISVLDECCTAGRVYKFGLELEFETVGTSAALHEVSPALHNRINAYMDAFEENGVVDEGGGIAYYTGSQGLIDMAKSTDPVNHATMDRMADLVAKRQAAKVLSGIDDVTVDHTQIAYAGEGCIFVSDDNPATRCYDITGRLVHSGPGRFYVPAGIYIVHTPGRPALKLQVR